MSPRLQRVSQLLAVGLFVPCLVGRATPVYAQSSTSDGDDPSEWADWDIEDLLAIRATSMTSVLGGHVHNKGEWMPMFYAMFMSMDGLRDGTRDLSTSDVHGSFPVAPLSMTMEMYMFGAMYGWSDELTLMAMVPYVRNSMDHRTATAVEFTTRSKGVGDPTLAALYTFWEDYDSHLHLNVGISVPLGSVTERDAAPMGARTKLPYPMQIGSGTWDLKPGVTYVREHDRWGFGVQGMGTLRIGENDQDYTLGDRYELVAWAQRKLSDSIGLSVRFKGQSWGNIDGSDPDLDPAVVPTADPGRQGGKRADLSVELQLFRSQGAIEGHRFELEVGVPVYESLDGPQLSTEYWAALSWSVTL